MFALLSHALQDLLALERGQACPHCRGVHPGHVVHRTEHADLVVHATVSLHALKQLLRIMKNLKRKKNRIRLFNNISWRRHFPIGQLCLSASVDFL